MFSLPLEFPIVFDSIKQLFSDSGWTTAHTMVLGEQNCVRGIAKFPRLQKLMPKAGIVIQSVPKASALSNAWDQNVLFLVYA